MSVSSGTILLVARAATGQPNVPDLLLTVALPLLHARQMRALNNRANDSAMDVVCGSVQ